jgi:beta-barrel assembly-enhancing protease
VLEIIYILFFILFVCFAYGQVRHLSIIRDINSLTSTLKYIPLIVTGRTVKAFTIEKAKMLSASETISIDAFTILAYRIFGLNIEKLHKRYINYARKLAYANIHSQVQNADYIVNIREEIRYVDSRFINIFVCCNALYRFEDTLPIFTFNRELIGAYVPTRKSRAYLALGLSLGTTFASIIGVSFLGSIYAAYLSSNLSLESEKALWSYVKESVINSRPTRVDLQKAQSSISSTLANIVGDDPEYPYEVFITNDEGVDFVMYPYGKMAMTKGLVEKLQTQNELAFVLAHMIGHYQNRDHLNSMGKRLLNMMAITSISGVDGVIGKALIWRSDFSYTSFADKKEVAANENALDVLNSKFGNVSGSDFLIKLNSDISEAHLDINYSHLMNQNISDAMADYVVAKDYVMGDVANLDFQISKVEEAPKFDISSGVIETPFISLFTKYREEIGTEQSRYSAFIKQYEGILNIDSSVSAQDLRERQQIAIKAASQIGGFKTKLRDILDRYNEEFKKVLSSEPKQESKIELTSMWNKEYNNVYALVDFYTNRDRAILENQAIILQFLATRYGKFSFNAYGLSFSSNKERDDYIVMQDRINKLIKQKPPSIGD